MKGFKGFDKNLQCRGFQFELGKEYETDKAVLCEKGFHACENPLDVFSYYPPTNGNKFVEVEGDGDVKTKDGEDTKFCCTKIKIGAEASMNALIKGSVSFVMERIKKFKEKTTATTGERANAATTGYWANAAVKGPNAIAAGIGIENKASAALGCWIVLAEWAEIKGEWTVKGVKTAKVDGNKIKANTWYELKNGKFVKAN